MSPSRLGSPQMFWVHKSRILSLWSWLSGGTLTIHRYLLFACCCSSITSAVRSDVNLQLMYLHSSWWAVKAGRLLSLKILLCIDFYKVYSVIGRRWTICDCFFMFVCVTKMYMVIFIFLLCDYHVWRSVITSDQQYCITLCMCCTNIYGEYGYLYFLLYDYSIKALAIGNLCSHNRLTNQHLIYSK